jgi:hypothetical protein
MSKSLQLASFLAVQKGLERSPDKFIRIALSADYPLEDALNRLFEANKDILIGLLSPYSNSNIFSSPNFPIERDSAILTELRNSRTIDSKPVVLIGLAIGSEESGLRDLASVLNEDSVAKEWKGVVRDSFKNLDQNHDSKVRTELADLVISKISKGEANPANAAILVDMLIDISVPLSTFQDNLFQIDLMPDDKLVGSQDFKKRLIVNASLVERSQSPDDVEFHEKLKKSKLSEVKSLRRWISTKKPEDLSQTSLPKILELLQLGDEETGPGTGTGTGSAGKPLIGILRDEKYLEEVDFKKNCIEAIVDELGEEYWLNGTLNSEVLIDTNKITFRISGSDSTHLEPWQKLVGRVDSDVSLKGDDSEKVPLFIYGENEDIQIAQNIFSNSAFRTWAVNHNLSDEVERYLESRVNLLRGYRLLSSPDEDLLILLFLSKEMRALVNEYLQNWNSLLRAAAIDKKLNQDDAVLLHFLDAAWIRKHDRSETVDNSLFTPKAKYEKVTLAPWHPWRLKPISQLAQEMHADPWDPENISSALWALSRAVPMYRVWAATSDKDNLQFKTAVDGNCEFTLVEVDAIQPLTGSVSAIQRSIRAYFDSHTWSKFGASTLILNPPSGGGVKKLVSSLSKFQQDVDLCALSVLRTKDVPGQEESDEFDNLIAFHDAEDLLDVVDGSQDFDISILFLPSLNATINSIQTGAHGKIDLNLKPKAVTHDGKQLYEPQITVAPDASNDDINLLFRVAGQESTQIATYPLVVQEEHRKLIERVVQNSEWTIVGIPGAVGAPEIYLDSNESILAPVIAQFDDNEYRCFTYTRSLLPLVWKIRDFVNANVPLSPSQDNQQILIKAIEGLASSQHTKMFELSNNKFGVNEIFGLMAARAFAKNLMRQNSLVLEISLDDTDWTNSWIDSSEQRADLILVDISIDPSDDVPVRLLVVEAKARSEGFGSPDPSVDPFEGASHQVQNTIDKLRHLMVGENTLTKSIRLRAFTEQLAAVASSEYMRSDKKSEFEVFFQNLSKFIGDPSSALESIQGLIVGLFTNGHEEAIIRNYDGENNVFIACSSRSLEEILLEKQLTYSELAENSHQRFVSEKGFPDIQENTRDLAPKDSAPIQSSSVEGTEESFVNKVAEKPFVAVDRSFAAPKENSGQNQVMQNQDADARNDKISNLIQNLRLYSSNIDLRSESTVSEGPTFDAFSIPLTPGAPLSGLQRSSQDIARELGVPGIEISNDPSRRGYVQILVPRMDRRFPLPPKKLANAPTDSYLPIYVGQKLNGDDHISTVQSWPHALVAGTTGSGKTLFLTGLIKQIANENRFPSKLIVVDGKGESDYFGAAPSSAYHSRFPNPETTMSATAVILEWLVQEEIPRRRALLNSLAKERNSRVDGKTEYLESLNHSSEPMFEPIVVVIDEFAELMLERGPTMQSFVDNVSSVCQTGRSTLVHLILATQRPDRKIVPGRIHANLDTKVALRVPTPADSMTVLGYGGAEKLLGLGDMLFSWKGSDNLRLQGYNFS